MVICCHYRLCFAAFLFLVSCKAILLVEAFQVKQVSLRRQSPKLSPKVGQRGIFLSSSNHPIDGKNEASLQKIALNDTLLELETIKSNIADAPNKDTLESLQSSLNNVEAKVTTQVSYLTPPSGLSASEYVAALRMYTKLPVRSRIAFCQALGIENPAEAALDFNRIPDIVTLLYTEGRQLTPSVLKAAMKSTENLRITERTTPFVPYSPLTNSSSSSPGNKVETFMGSSVVEEQDNEEFDAMQQLVEQLFCRTTRQEGRVATSQDLQTLLNDGLGRETFVVSEKEEIPGGYLVRGKPVAKLSSTPGALLEAINQKLPDSWDCQVSVFKDFTAPVFGESVDDNALVLVLLKKDMTPEPRTLLRSVSSLTAFVTATLFSIGVYGGNNLVMSRLEERSSTGDFVGFEWFTEKAFAVLLPIVIIQFLHEAGHALVAKRDNLKVSPPTLLPGWGLPFLGCLNNIKESPKNLTSLYDFAIAGPVLGLLASVGLFVYGLELTNAAGPEVLKYLPALPVDVLRSSTLAGSLIDYILGGGQGFITLQDPKMSVPLHPLAIAGFTGLLANALSLLPIGSTDGGRVSLAVFGRQGHLVIGSAVWLFLLIASFTFERADAIIGAWVVYNIVQNDAEIPCQDEVTQVDTVRAATAFLVWFAAILTIVPMQ